MIGTDMKTREEMITALREGVCRVVFTKVNGETRDMTCTLETRNIPEESRPRTEGEYSDSVIRVYDLNAAEWRSFKVANVISIDNVVVDK
jgi:hypothetical protein